jgi:hypothetical protein
LNLHYLTTERLKIPIAIAAGLALGVALAVAVGSGAFSTVRRVFLFGLVLGMLLFGRKYAWRLAFAVCLFDCFYLGLDFRVSNIEQTGVLAGLIILITCWRKEQIKRPAVMETMTFGIFNLTLLLWLVYSLGHLVYNTLDPYNPSEFALKNFLKTVVQFSGPLLIMFYFIHRPTGIVVNRRLPIDMIAIGLLAVATNIFVRLWEVTHGMLDPGNAIEGETPYFTITSLDLMANIYALRTLGPLLGVLSISFLKGPWFDRQSFMVRSGVWLLFVLSFIGAAVSGGRATLLFVFILSLAVLWLRRYRQLVLGLVGAGLVFVIGLNLIPDVLQPFPMIVQRSLQSIVFTAESEQAKASIDSSTAWRIELVQRAFELWRADSRVFWFGRGTYSFGADDVRALQTNAGVGAMEVSLRRGATHSLVTDLLLVFGLVGFVIYMTMFVSLLVLLWRLWKSPRSDEIARSLALICFLLALFNLIYGSIGGGSLPVHIAWLLVILFAYLYRVEAVSGNKPMGPLKMPTRRILRPLPALSAGRAPQGVARVRRFAGP